MRVIVFAFWSACCLVATGLAAQKSGSSGEIRLILSHVQFAAEKATLNAEATSELNDVADLMRAQPAVRVDIGAHTDASGSTAYNLRLSQKRAQAVSAYLNRQGISQNRLNARGYGESRPLNRCRRGVRCSEAEKRANRRIEMVVRGVPEDSIARAPWLAIGGVRPKKAVQTPKVPAITPQGAQPETAAPAVTKPAELRNTDFFPELSDQNKKTTPKPLPATFAGYTVELHCSPKPLAAGQGLFNRFEAVYLYDEPGGPYCYYTGAFFTLPEAQQFLREKVAPYLPDAKVTLFANRERTYF